MRLAVALVLVLGCTTQAPDEPGPTTPEPEPDPSPEAIPTRACGAPDQGGHAGCSPFQPLCFGWASSPFGGAGDCISAPAAGTLDVRIDGAARTATRVAAIANGAKLELSAEVDGQTLLLLTRADVGTLPCDVLRGVALAGDVTYRSFGETADCSITLTEVGEVGEDVAGTFSGTLVEYGPGRRTLVITDGAFRVERVAY